MVPTEVDMSFKNYFDILTYVLENYKIIVKFRDNHSKVIKKFIEIIGYEKLRKRDISSLEELVFFVE